MEGKGPGFLVVVRLLPLNHPRAGNEWPPHVSALKDLLPSAFYKCEFFLHLKVGNKFLRFLM